MDAPNAPNPANPNAQDQFLDVLQDTANQAQGLANNNAQIGQDMPMQPPQQPALQQPGPTGPVVPAQPVPVQQGPIGSVVPAPQMFYQNWIRK